MADYRLGFTTLESEAAAERLPVRGALPDWLAGSLVRNGPAMFDHGDRSFRHWFDGQGMLHRFELGDGAVGYANRLLDTPGSRSLREHGRIGYAEFATDPCVSLFGRFFTQFRKKPSGNGCVNVTRAGGQDLAVTETTLAVRFDPTTLATAGVVDYGAALGGPVTTAHPHAAPGTRDSLNYVLRFGRHSEYVLYRQAADAAGPTVFGRVGADLPGYVHSFGVTERHLLLAIFPLAVHPLSFVLRNRPFIENYRWRPELELRIVAVSLADGSIRADLRAPAAFAFHHINAYEPDEHTVVMDLCAYPDSSIVDAFYLDRLRAGQSIPVPVPTRYTLDLDSGSVAVTTITDEPLDLPRINYGRHNGRPYRFAYGCGADRSGTNFFDRLSKVDVDTGEALTWREDGCYPGEPVFVATPGGTAEDDGVILSVVLDATAGRSALLVLDAASLTELARAEVPHAIPFGFHGQFSRGA